MTLVFKGVMKMICICIVNTQNICVCVHILIYTGNRLCLH